MVSYVDVAYLADNQPTQPARQVLHCLTVAYVDVAYDIPPVPRNPSFENYFPSCFFGRKPSDRERPGASFAAKNYLKRS